MAQSDVERLKRGRNAAKGWLNRAGESLNSLLSSKTCERYELEMCIALFDKRLTSFENSQAALELAQSEADTEADQAAGFLDDLLRVRAKAGKTLNEMAAPSTANSAAVFTKLPRLNLPNFSGKPDEWSAFWEAFVVAVDKTALPEVTKLTYLRSLLRGEALRCVDGLSLTMENYKVTCDLLSKRFGRHDLVVFSHVQALLDLVPASLDKLRELVNTLLIHIRSLESLGITGESYGVLLNPIILSRLPQPVRLEWAREAEGKEGDLAHLISFLTREVEQRGRSGVYTTLTGAGCTARTTTSASQGGGSHFFGGRRAPTAGPERRSSGRSHGLASGAALHSAELKCSFCGKGHQAEKCRAFLRLNVQQRMQRLREIWGCFACLEVGHRASACSRICDHCGGKHHILLCHKNRGSGGKRSDQAAPAPLGQGASVVGPLGGGAQVGGVSLSCERDEPKKWSVLPVARVLVRGHGGRLVEANLLFVSGSDTSHVTMGLVRKVQPQWCGSAEVGYAVFGGGKTPRASRDVYELNVSGSQSSLPHAPQILRAVAVPAISAPLTRPLLPTSLLS